MECRQQMNNSSPAHPNTTLLGQRGLAFPRETPRLRRRHHAAADSTLRGARRQRAAAQRGEPEGKATGAAASGSSVRRRTAFLQRGKHRDGGTYLRASNLTGQKHAERNLLLSAEEPSMTLTQEGTLTRPFLKKDQLGSSAGTTPHQNPPSLHQAKI